MVPTSSSKPKLIVTLGPATSTFADLLKLKDKGVDFVRINMSHSSHEDLRNFLGMAKRAGLPFILDTDGSQVRTGWLEQKTIELQEGAIVRIHHGDVVGDHAQMSLRPKEVVEQLACGDLLFVDFDTLVLRVSDVATVGDGFIVAHVVTRGVLGRNKAVTIVPAIERQLQLPVLSVKDRVSIDIGLAEGIGHIAVSFVRRAEDIEEVKIATNNAMHIIAKVESRESLQHLDEIIVASDSILVDRGDLSKEIPVERVPLVQKIILERAHERRTPVFVATNLLESMIVNRKPTRAEVHDVVRTILDGADGLILSAETAIGKHPFESINMINKLVDHAHRIGAVDHGLHYLSVYESEALTPPHGGILVEHILQSPPAHLGTLQRIVLTPEQQMDVEQIAIGTYSPLGGFLGEEDFHGVLDSMRLRSGVTWPIPIVLDVTSEDADRVRVGEEVALTDGHGAVLALLRVDEKYRFDREEMIRKLYLTSDPRHPGVAAVMRMRPVLLGGRVDLVRRVDSEFKEYELTPRQARRLFEDRGWVKVVGFHTRNVIHRGHEFIQMRALEQTHCDGLFVHPIVGRKKVGDFRTKYIIESYEWMMREVYPKDKVVLATFATFSRYAGPREALFTALCRKNFGCSHFVVGRDHTGVGTYYHPNAAHQIFEKFPDIGIIPVKFDEVFYSDTRKTHVHEREVGNDANVGRLQISGTQARKLLEALQSPPEWFMRPEISSMLLRALANGEVVFVKE